MTREERIMLAAYRGFSDVVEIGGATVLLVPEGRESPMLNRVVGLGRQRPATEADLDAAIDVIPSGTTFYVAVPAAAEPPELGDWLPARGLEPGWGWMVFQRGIDVPEKAQTAVYLLDVVTDEHRAAFARIVTEGYGLPQAIEPRIARAADEGWDCLLACDGDEPIGAAGLFAAEGAGYLGFAATLPGHRGKGAQSALLAERIRRAAAAGWDVLLTETGERRDDRPSNSYRNILRAGFAEMGVTANWVGTRA